MIMENRYSVKTLVVVCIAIMFFWLSFIFINIDWDADFVPPAEKTAIIQTLVMEAAYETAAVILTADANAFSLTPPATHTYVPTPAPMVATNQEQEDEFNNVYYLSLFSEVIAKYDYLNNAYDRGFTVIEDRVLIKARYMVYQEPVDDDLLSGLNIFFLMIGANDQTLEYLSLFENAALFRFEDAEYMVLVQMPLDNTLEQIDPEQDLLLYLNLIAIAHYESDDVWVFLLNGFYECGDADCK